MPRKRPRRHERTHGSGSVKEIRPNVWRAWKPPQPDATRPSRTFKGPAARQDAEQWITGVAHAGPLLLGHYLERWFAAREATLSRQTRQTYLHALEHAETLADAPLATTGVQQWQAWTAGLLERGVILWKWQDGQHVPTGERRPMAVSTVAKIKAIISIALNDAVPDYLPANPLRRVRLPRRPPAEAKAWTMGEVGRLLRTVRGARDEAMIHVGLAVGPRLGELRELRWPDLDERTGLLTIARSLSDDGKVVGPTKTRRARTVKLPAETLAILMEARKRQPVGEERMFGGWSAGEYRRRLALLCREAGVTVLAPHSLRHTAASIQLADRVPLPKVARMLGHTVGVLTRVYSHWIGDEGHNTVDAARSALYGAPGTESGTTARVLHAPG